MLRFIKSFLIKAGAIFVSAFIFFKMSKKLGEVSKALEVEKKKNEKISKGVGIRNYVRNNLDRLQDEYERGDK